MRIRLINEPIEAIHHDGGFAHKAITGRPDLSGHEKPSSARVLENGVPLPGPANAPHDDIRSLGGGRYSFWYEAVYFSSSDGSDPATNGRRYEIAYAPTWQRPAREWMAGRIEYWRNVDYWEKFYRLCFWYVWRRGMVVDSLRRLISERGRR